MRSQTTLLAAVLAAALVPGSAARAATLALSTDSGATLGGVSFTNGTVVEYDTVTNTTTVPVLFDEALFPQAENVDAFDLLPNGHMVLSTISTATLGGISFSDGSLVEWDPVNLVASLLFDENSFGGSNDKNIDAAAVLPNGNILISTEADETLAGTSFRDGDIVEWDGSTATLFFSEDLFGGVDVDIDAFDVGAAGYLLSLRDNNVSVGGITFDNGDVVLYDPSTGSWSVYFSESAEFSANEDVDAVAFVPEPATASMLGLGLAGLAFAGRRRRPS